jgi:hypothetical protein
MIFYEPDGLAAGGSEASVAAGGAGGSLADFAGPDAFDGELDLYFEGDGTVASAAGTGASAAGTGASAVGAGGKSGEKTAAVRAESGGSVIAAVKATKALASAGGESDGSAGKSASQKPAAGAESDGSAKKTSSQKPAAAAGESAFAEASARAALRAARNRIGGTGSLRESEQGKNDHPVLSTGAILFRNALTAVVLSSVGATACTIARFELGARELALAGGGILASMGLLAFAEVMDNKTKGR